MRKLLSLLSLSALAIPILTGCGNGNSAIGTCTANCPAQLTPVSLSATDTPPDGVSVLSFQIQLTAATLNPTSGRTSPVSLLPNESGPSGSSTPVSIDATQLQAVSQFLSSSSVPSTGYDSLSLTFANPKLVIYNVSDSAITGTCPIGSVCQITPTISGLSGVNLPLSYAQPALVPAQPLSLLLDFHLNTILQSDFSLNLGAPSGITVSQIPSASPQLGYITGSLPTVHSNVAGQSTFQFISQDNRTYTIDTSSATTFNNFPASGCSTGSLSCLAEAQNIRIQVGGISANGEPNAAKIDYIQSATQQTVDGTVIGLIPSPTNIAGAPPYNLTLLIRNNPTNNPNLLPGTVATVTFGSGIPSYSIDSDGFTIPAGLSFSNGDDFMVGQNIRVNIISGSLTTLTGQPPSSTWSAPQSVSFQTNAVALRPSQFTATIATLNSSAQSFTFSGSTGAIFLPWTPSYLNASSATVIATAQTTYQGADTFSGLANNDVVSVNGWLFPLTTNGNAPTVAAQSIVVRTAGSL
ncbi:MAG: hypothetical protein ACP5M4_02270 [Acidobacteriaceae bacterium]